MIENRQSFIDWMKAVGMLLIVVGHVIGSPYHIFNEANQPIYSKQLGVSFFVFVMGWGLANEKRNGIQVVFNRLFPMYFWGVVAAVIVSVIFYIVSGDLVESNYLPFFAGVNVLFDNFPANPTTWYIGTYLHILLFWLFFSKGRAIGVKQLIIAFVFENTIRCIFLYLNKDFIAYMLLPNWLTVFLLGSYMAQQQDRGWTKNTTLLLAVWLVVMALWANAQHIIPFDEAFPFRDFVNNPLWTLPFRSLFISVIYLFNTYVFFQVARSLPLIKPVGFFARNTIIIFIAHMPIIFNFANDFYSLFSSRTLGNWALIAAIFVGLALVSEVAQKLINVKKLSLWTAGIINKFFPKLQLVSTTLPRS